jgi:cysteine desulfurase
LVIRLDLEGIAVSTGSACSSGTLLPSPAIRSLGLSREHAGSVVRFSLSRLTTDAELTRVLEVLPGIVTQSRHVASEGAIETVEELAPR